MVGVGDRQLSVIEGTPFPSMPPESPLEMPTQRLRKFDTTSRRTPAPWPGFWQAQSSVWRLPLMPPPWCAREAPLLS